MDRGWTPFVTHTAALRYAIAMNRALGFKMRKVVVEGSHFIVVDHTWERND